MQTVAIDPSLMLDIVRNEDGPIAFDTETTGLEVQDTVVGYVVGNEGYALYTPVRHSGGGNIPRPEEFEAALNDAFNDRSRCGYLTVGHNLGFDLRAALRHGIKIWHPVEDTMINEALLSDLTNGYSLDAAAERYGITPKNSAPLYQLLADRFGGIADRKQMQHFHKLPGDLPEVLDYAAGDGITTLQLWHAQRRPLSEELSGKTLDRVHALECRLIPYLARMHHRGIKVDHDYADRILDDKNPDGIKQQEARLLEKFPQGFNPRSGQEVEALFRANGFGDADFARTDKGAPSFREKWLEKSELGEAILDVRRIQKLRDSFFTPLVSTHNVGGRVHAILNQSKSDDFGVAGARLSCSDPNLQAYPKRNKVIGKLVRPLLIPDFGRIYEDDFQQQEPRFFTHYSEEPALVAGYKAGTLDMHDRANEILFNGADRDRAKRLGMGMLTMMSPPTLAMHMDSTLAEAKEWHRGFLSEAFPMIGKFQQDVVATFRSRGYVFSILGRRAFLEHKKFAYQGVSRVIQNSGGDHAKTGLLMANEYEDAYPDEIQMLMTIHDSFLFQTESVAHAREMQRILESAAPKVGCDIPIPVDVGFGENWSEASYIKRGKEWFNL